MRRVDRVPFRPARVGDRAVSTPAATLLTGMSTPPKAEIVSSAKRVHSVSAAMVAMARCICGWSPRYPIRVFSRGSRPAQRSLYQRHSRANRERNRASDSLGASSNDRDLFQEQEIDLPPIELPGKPVVVRQVQWVAKSRRRAAMNVRAMRA